MKNLIIFAGLFGLAICLHPAHTVASSPQTGDARYWFDNDTTYTCIRHVDGDSYIDVSQLEEGLHTLHYQYIGDNGALSPALTSTFIRTPTETIKFKDYTVKEVRYWIDNNISTIYGMPYQDGLISLDLSMTSEGEHTLNYQVFTDDNAYSPVRSAKFFRNLYDIYIREEIEYTPELMKSDSIYSSRPDLKLHYNIDDVTDRGHLSIQEGTALSLGKYVHTLNTGCLNWLAWNENLDMDGVAHHHPTTLINSGEMRADSVIIRQQFYRDKWHFIHYPFNVNMSAIDTPVGAYYAIREYDGMQRASKNLSATWKDVARNGILDANRGYILQVTSETPDECIEFVLKSLNDIKKNDIFTNKDVKLKLETFESDFAHNNNWNLIGNPYPCIYNIRFIDTNGIIIVWNGDGYSAYSTIDDEYFLMPFEAFFMQKPNDSDNVTFLVEGRQHNIFNKNVMVSPIRQAKRAETDRHIINLMLSNENYSDNTRIVLNESSSLDYEEDCDAPKIMPGQIKIPQIYSVYNGVSYAINERPIMDGEIDLSVYSPEETDYTISLKHIADSPIYLTDIVTGSVTDLSEAPYCFNMTTGFHDKRFKLSLCGNVNGVHYPKEILKCHFTTQHGIVTLHFNNPTEVSIFEINGRPVFNEITSETTIRLNTGIYIVKYGEVTSKIFIK